MRKYNFENKDLASKAGAKGSRKGVQNRSTKQVREAFRLLIDNNLERMQADLDSLEPKERLMIIIQLSKFVLPQLQAVSVKDITEKQRPVILLDTSLITNSIENETAD